MFSRRSAAPEIDTSTDQRPADQGAAVKGAADQGAAVRGAAQGAAAEGAAAEGAAAEGAAADRGATVEFQKVSKRFDGHGGPAVLDSIDFTVAGGEFTSIIGPSGCGKSTLLRIAGDLLDPTSGQVLIDGQPAGQARTTHRTGFVFQAPNLCPWRTVRRNVELPLETTGTQRGERRQRALEQLAIVGLEAAADKYPHELSGGMAQRVAIARALVFQPPIVFMDEPFGALDEITRERLNLELHDLWRRTHKTVLFVTHSIPEAVLLATRVLVMAQSPGRIARIIDIHLPDERRSTIESTPEFFEAVTEVRAALHEVMGQPA